MQATFIKMSDADKLVTCKRNMADASAKKLAGEELEKHMGEVLGLIKVGKKDPQGTVKIMYKLPISYSCLGYLLQSLMM